VSRCRRFEEEGLLRVERGLPLDDEHFVTCPDCQEAAAAYDRLRAGIAALGADLAPPERWQARVWQEVETRRARRFRWRPLVFAGGLAAALVAVLLLRAPPPDAAIALRVEVQAGATSRRGEEARPGDSLALRADIGGAPHAELRVYRNDRELLLHCSDQPPCTRERGAIATALTLDSPGRYQPLLLVGEEPLPAPAGELDADAAAAAAAGATVKLGGEIVVR
jgi:hypothetical protein